jgi:two-component system CheB/CheR fusion protein
MKPELESKKSEADEPGKGPIVVGVGASAGGLEAFKSFLSAMPVDSGMAFVLIQHLAPDHVSMLAELLGRSTQMKVSQAENGMKIEANQVYIIPPDATLTVEKRHLVVTSPAPPREYRRPIDTFFFSLAQDQGEKAVCIILSGTGSDGSLGVTAIKEQGGLTFAQAEFDHQAKNGMPKSANATGAVDHLLQVEAMPAMLMEYQQHLRKVQPKKDKEGSRSDLSDCLPQIFAQLRTGIGHDFSHYKEKTLLRRVQRRMQVLQVDEPLDFINVLQQEPKELELLFQDLLISVTEFFRDPAAFQVLEEQIIPKLLEDKGADSQVRLWVVACATGEEAYSIAILLAEALERLSAAPKAIIFATDIDDKALSFARNGRYMKSHLDGVSPERLKRWFFLEGDQYCISPQIREMCIFSAHSVIKDPPFSKLDLVSCRNLLIYFDATLQDRLIPVLHYALKPGGILFLGSSEGIGRRNDLFGIINEKYRLFRRLDATTASLPNYPLSTSEATKNGRAPIPSFKQREAIFDRGARRVMERYSPTHVVIDKNHQVQSFSGQTGKYLDPSPGAASLDFFHLIQKALRPTAHILLQKALENQERVVKEHIPFEVNGASETVTLIVEPILQASGEAQHYIFIFQQVEDNHEKPEDETLHERKPTEVELLESELRVTKERLEAALDETNEAIEDLKSSNEEFQSINEELHSSNEELETSKEEMQSINEELQTVNAELSNKNQLLVRVNSDIQNFFESTHIATLFLDENLCVRNFTPTVTELFHLRESDKGRRVTEVASRLNYDCLESDVKETLKSLEVIEREVTLPESDATFVMKIQPYRTVQKTIEGVVITFVDISDRKRYEVALKEAKEEAEAANGKKDEFLAMMSHELRTPLNSIIGFSRMMETGRAGPLNKKQARYMQNIGSSGAHLLTIINDLLDLSKIEAGKMEVSYESIDIISIVDEVKSMMFTLAQPKNVQLSFEIPSDIGHIDADPARFKQILINLISNAIKFNREEAGSVVVRLHRSKDQAYLVGVIQDIGIGIPQEKLSALFQKFHQVDTSPSRKHEGTGLGLALTKELIELHGGNITVDSEIGVGTTFTFKLLVTHINEKKPQEGASDDS